MNRATQLRLNALNAAFYDTTAAAFSATRQQPWPGWVRLLATITLPAAPRVLDIGCGNGRLGVFLAAQYPAMHYHGLDQNAALLAEARRDLAAWPGVSSQLGVHDLLADTLPAADYDLVALFGVLHHIPGAAQRQALMQQLAQCVAPGGWLAFAAWRFVDYPRFRARIIPWETLDPPLAMDQLEPGDYLLDWRQGAVALRYCHAVDDAEQAALIAASGLQLIVTYRADGQDNALNQYSVVQRPP